MKLCLVCSSGGHFLQMQSLREFFKEHERVWVTFSGKDTEYLLRREKVYWAYHPTNRNVKHLFKNLLLAFKIIRAEKPHAILSTGAGVAVPFMLVGRFFGIKTIYIESLTRVKSLSLTGRLVYPFVNHFFVQWPELAKSYRKTQYKGQVV